MVEKNPSVQDQSEWPRARLVAVLVDSMSDLFQNDCLVSLVVVVDS